MAQKSNTRNLVRLKRRSGNLLAEDDLQLWEEEVRKCSQADGWLLVYYCSVN